MSSSPSVWKTKARRSRRNPPRPQGPAHLARQSRSPRARGQTDTSAKRFREMTLATEADLQTNLSKRQPAVTEQLLGTVDLPIHKPRVGRRLRIDDFFAIVYRHAEIKRDCSWPACARRQPYSSLPGLLHGSGVC